MSLHALSSFNEVAEPHFVPAPSPREKYPRLWREPEQKIGGLQVRELRFLYAQRLKRAAEFPSEEDEYNALHAVAMMQKAHHEEPWDDD